MIRDSDRMPLAIGRYLAETFYENSRALYQTRRRKRFSLRALQRLLHERARMNRSFSSLRQMVAAHFQEPDLALSPDDAAALSWSARVVLLRVRSLSDKSRLVKECLDRKWSVRDLALAARGGSPDAQPDVAQPPSAVIAACTPAMAPRTKGERILYKALRLCRQLQDWKNPDAGELDRVREVVARISYDVARLHTALCDADGKPSASPSPRPAVPRVHTPPEPDVEPPHATSADAPKPAPSAPRPFTINTPFDFSRRDNGPANYISLNLEIQKYGP
jgi:hypothetical protein